MPLNIIVATDESHGIGKDNTIPWKNTTLGKLDLKFFKQMTSKKGPNGELPVIVMGANTYKSCGNLPNRIMAIVGSQYEFKSVFEAVNKYLNTHPIWICGGRNIYLEALTLGPQKIYITKMPFDYDCDVLVPEIDLFCTTFMRLNTNVSANASFCDLQVLEYVSSIDIDLL